jgi:hypothetical protein
MATIDLTTGGAKLLRLRTSLATGMPHSGIGNRVFAGGGRVCARGLTGMSEQSDGDRVSAAGEAM